MSDKFQDKYRIPSARLPNWDYGWNAMYFVTICTVHRECYFGNITDGKMGLSEIGEIAHRYWHEIPNHFPFVELGEFVIMPNHVHGIIIIDKPERELADDMNKTMGNAIVETPNLGVSTTTIITTADSVDNRTTARIKKMGTRYFRGHCESIQTNLYH